MDTVPEQQNTYEKLTRVAQIFIASEGEVRPHFILTGPSGSGKSHLMQRLATEFDLNYMEVNAAQLTKEGTAGNSLSKALSELKANPGLTLCFVDEFDKLFISGNSNGEIAHEITNGVQNEFLRVLEAETTSVFGDYGKYIKVPVSNVLFVFAGAFNGEEDLDVDRLREFGIKTEFLGRVNLLYNLEKLSLDSMEAVLNNSTLFASYCKLFPHIDSAEAKNQIMDFVKLHYEKNTLGVRLLHSLIHQYFINGGKLETEAAEKSAFNRTLKFEPKETA